VPGALMSPALHEQDFLCRIFGKCLVGEVLDEEVETVIGKGIPDVPKLFTYARYNVELSREGLDALGLTSINPAQFSRWIRWSILARCSKLGGQWLSKK